jgi:hypothetical protein
MKVVNIHERTFASSPAAVGALLDSLASPDDRLWPKHLWPSMRFDRPLEVGARGGHGPIRYVVTDYEKGRSVTFRFENEGFDGTHRFDVVAESDGTRLRHTIEMDAKGRGLVAWSVAIRYMHDACVEDLLDKAEKNLTGHVAMPARHSRFVRALRAGFRLALRVRAR